MRKTLFASLALTVAFAAVCLVLFGTVVSTPPKGVASSADYQRESHKEFMKEKDRK